MGYNKAGSVHGFHQRRRHDAARATAFGPRRTSSSCVGGNQTITTKLIAETVQAGDVTARNHRRGGQSSRRCSRLSSICLTSTGSSSADFTRAAKCFFNPRYAPSSNAKRCRFPQNTAQWCRRAARVARIDFSPLQSISDLAHAHLEALVQRAPTLSENRALIAQAFGVRRDCFRRGKNPALRQQRQCRRTS